MNPRVFRAFKPELRETDLPDGVIGQIAGIALVYDELDNHGTMFARGCLARTRKERVAAGKVKLFWDHGNAPTNGFYDSDLHIGTVRSLEDVQLPDGRWAAYMVADLLDTPKAHEAHQYIKSVLASGGETGLSVGALSRSCKSEVIRHNGDPVERFTEFPLGEISVTSMQSVPDSEVLAVRSQENQGSLEAALDALLPLLPTAFICARLKLYQGNADGEDTDAPNGDRDATAEDSRSTPVEFATMEARLMALRQSYPEAA